ncbi:chromate transporter [Paenibacillus rigui]|uniref:Chromate transporter n=1 Tax=Paenibacillus rigui TaxID=554312 RepID=A0A229UVD8_9BACL|nr:chromate transporter [Paenibacillus rigui]OXM87340.1 chromate transporter [Paenibacillus rigui]
MLMTLWKLFAAFGTATMLGYGGGPSIIPLYEDQVVTRNQWMDTAEFGRTLAFGNALPGPIATKLAAFIGFKVAGWAGMLVALTAVVMPTALIMVALAGVMLKLDNNPYIKGMIRGVQPIIFVMMAMLAYDFAKYMFQGSPHSFVSFLPFLLGAAFFVMVQYLNLNPVWGILLALGVGAFFMRG